MSALSVVETAPRPPGPAAYPDDLGPGMQAELTALADIETRFEGVLAHLGRRPGAEVRRQRLEACAASAASPIPAAAQLTSA